MNYSHCSHNLAYSYCSSFVQCEHVCSSVNPECDSHYDSELYRDQFSRSFWSSLRRPGSLCSYTGLVRFLFLCPNRAQESEWVGSSVKQTVTTWVNMRNSLFSTVELIVMYEWIFVVRYIWVFGIVQVTFQRFLTLTSPMAVTVMEARRQVAFQFDYLLDELPLGCQDHYLDRGRPVAEREQIHLDIQLRFHQMNDSKDFEIAPNSRQLKFSLDFGPSILKTVCFPLGNQVSKTYIQRRTDLYNLSVAFVLYDLMIFVYMFSAVLLSLLHDDKSNDSFLLTRRLMYFHFLQL